jgi:hypothetical protein
MRSRAPLRASELGHNAGACAPYRMAYLAMAFVPVKLLQRLACASSSVASMTAINSGDMGSFVSTILTVRSTMKLCAAKEKSTAGGCGTKPIENTATALFEAG